MKYVTIESVLSKKITGEWGKDPIDSTGTKVIRTTNFTNLGIIDYSKIVSRKIEQKKIEQKKLYSGDVIIEKSGGSPTQPVGRVVFFVNPDDSIYLCNNFTSILRPNLDLVSPKYFFYTLFYNHLSKKTLRYQNKTTGIINLQLERYLKSKIPLPLLDDQIRIATILSRAENLIAKRKESIEFLDKLLKSTFLEMFGDPVRNEKGWEKEIFDTFSESRLGKMRDKKFITGAHLRKYIGNSNVRWFRFIFDDLLKMDFNSKERNTFHLNNGDLLICEGGEIGRCAIWKSGIEDCYFQKALHRVRLDLNQAIPEYIQYVMLFYSLRNGFKNVTSKATIPHLTGVKLKATSIPLPPITLQNKFAQILKKVESIKSKYQQSLTELENLYGALSQRAFKGELDLSKIPIKEKPEPIAGTADITLPAMKMEGEITVQKPFSNQKLLKVKKRTRTLIMK